MTNPMITETPSLLTDILTTTYFDYLGLDKYRTFTSPIESSELLERTDFHKDMEYKLTKVDCRLENCVEYEYRAEYKNGSGFTSALGFILKDERNNNKDNINHNLLELERVRDVLETIGVIPKVSHTLMVQTLT
tara:strand:+ start:308 stop:709 length:402 start_codon:yes stop_codon:yes gene_type:complete